MLKYKITFKPSGRGKAQCPPDPRFSNGLAINMAKPGRPFCNIELPYPAPECGYWHVECSECCQTVVLTAAGRSDDPKTIVLACLETDKEKFVELNKGGRRSDELHKRHDDN